MTSLLNFTYSYFQSVLDECLSLVGTPSNFAPNIAANLHGPTQLLENCQDTLEQWFSYDDFQLQLLKGFSILLVVNILFILFAWRVYGERIYETFMKPVTPKVIEDLKKSVSQLKLPKEHSPRV